MQRGGVGVGVGAAQHPVAETLTGDDGGLHSRLNAGLHWRSPADNANDRGLGNALELGRHLKLHTDFS